jgi:3'(2'), 5'-bisphosphate nucleotidase
MTAFAASDLDDRLAFAARIATDAGNRLLAIRASGRWTDEAILGDVADQAADGYLQGAVRARFGDDGVLSEETVDAPERLARRWTWVVDPLDGTREYGQQRHDWAVHVGLVFDGAAVAGAVGLPTIGRTFAGVCVGATRLTVAGSGGDWPTAAAADAGPDPARPLRIAVSRSHTPEIVQHLARELGGAELVPCGSVGFKVALVLFGKADVYVHRKGLKEWDTCAPEAVARAAGYDVCRFDGRPHAYNQADPRNDELVVCRPWLRARVLAALASARR